MAALGAQTVASSYEQLLHTDTDGGGNGNTLVTIKDGDNGTTFGLKLATNKVEVIPSAADDANAFEVSKNDGTAVFTVDSSSPAVSITGNTTMTTADNTVTLTLTSTDADDNVGPKLHLYRNSGSPAANDFLGEVEFVGRNNNSQDVAYASINGFINDTTDGQEDGRIDIRSMLAGTEVSRIKVDINEVVFNDDSKDVDFRVESDGNANMLVVDANVNRVGIGVATPGSPLDVESSEAANTANFNSTSGATNITLESSGSLIGQIEFASSGTSQIVTRTSASLAFGSNNVKTLYITDDDRVGIGTSSPDAKLEVTDGLGQVSTGMILHNARNANNNNFLRFQKANTDGSNETIVSSGDYLGQIDFQGCDANNAYHTGLAMYAVTEGTVQSDQMPTGLHIYTCNTSGATAERMRITADGRLGIGLTDPGHLLDVTAADGASDNNAVARFVNAEATDGRSKGVYIRAGSTSDDWPLYIEDHDASNALIKITGAGRLGINASSPNARLDINEGTSGQELIHLNHSASGVQTMLLFKTSSTTRGTIQSDNSPSQTAYNTSSDERLKENISEVNDALSIVNKIPVKQFNFIEDENNTPVIGYIGQELIKEYPLAVSVIKTDEYDDHHMVDQSKMVAVLMKAVQELSAKVEELEGN